MSIARVETPSACSRSSSPGIRADASSSVAPQLRIGFRSTRLYSAANAAAIATAPIPDLTGETDARRLAPACARTVMEPEDRLRRSRGGVDERITNADIDHARRKEIALSPATGTSRASDRDRC